MKTLRPDRLWTGICLTSMMLVGLQAWGAAALDEDAARDSAESEGPGVGSPEVSSPEARAIVVRLEDALLGIMKRADDLGFDGRLREIAPVVESTFDLEFMSRTTVGTVWRQLTPELKARWVESFSRYTTAKFADQFDRYSGQEFLRNGERSASRQTVVVMTSVHRRDKEPVRLDFRLHLTQSGWRIIDVYGKGQVSELALRRSEYDVLLKKGGIEGLIESVDELSARVARESVTQRAP